MRSFIAALLMALSTVPALGECRPTAEAMAYVAAHKLRPVLIRGVAMKPYIDSGKLLGLEIETIHFVAVIKRGKGAIAFLGNFHVVCGPIEMSSEDLNQFARMA